MAGFKKAQRTASKLKCGIQGASGSGKTYSALKIATALVARTDPGKGIAFIDTERSAALYAPPFVFDVDDDFGEGQKLSYHPDKLIEKLEAARKAGTYGAVIVDSGTYFWKEQGGLLSMIDSICQAQRAKGQKGDSFAAWKTVDPIYRKLMNYIRQYPLHVILCIRAKQTYEKVEGANGKGSVKKVGLEGEFRDGWEFEMDAQFAIDQDHVLVPLKHRLGAFLDGKIFKEPGDDVAELVQEWLAAGAPGQEVPVEEVKITVNGPSVTAADPVVVEPEPAPTTVPETPPEDVVAHLLNEIVNAPTADALKMTANTIKSSLKDKLITAEEYNGVLSPAYALRNKALKEAVAA